ncbi:MAG: polysaccharide deacetylase family protein [Alcanivoracaceae bacterium]
MNRQRLLANTMLATGTLALARHLSTPQIRILAYHRILDDHLDPRSLTDAGLFSATASGFSRQLRWLSRHFDCITFHDLASGNYQRPLIITFDDGYEDNHRLAWPILRSLGLKAVFFVTTDFIDGHGAFWFDRASAAASIAQPDEPIAALLTQLKRLNSDERGRQVHLLEQQAGLATPAQGPAMSWQALREMADSGMEIGSHSCSHAVLANESVERIHAELAISRQRIEQQLGHPCTSLSYPVGGRSAVNGIVEQQAEQCGYQYACSYISGTNRLPLERPLMLNRQHVEIDQSHAEFIASTSMPALLGYR